MVENMILQMLFVLLVRGTNDGCYLAIMYFFMNSSVLLVTPELCQLHGLVTLLVYYFCFSNYSLQITNSLSPFSVWVKKILLLSFLFTLA